MSAAEPDPDVALAAAVDEARQTYDAATAAAERTHRQAVTAAERQYERAVEPHHRRWWDATGPARERREREITAAEQRYERATESAQRAYDDAHIPLARERAESVARADQAYDAAMQAAEREWGHAMARATAEHVTGQPQQVSDPELDRAVELETARKRDEQAALERLHARWDEARRTARSEPERLRAEAAAHRDYRRELATTAHRHDVIAWSEDPRGAPPGPEPREPGRDELAEHREQLADQLEQATQQERQASDVAPVEAHTGQHADWRAAELARIRDDLVRLEAEASTERKTGLEWEL